MSGRSGRSDVRQADWPDDSRVAAKLNRLAGGTPPDHRGDDDGRRIAAERMLAGQRTDLIGCLKPALPFQSVQFMLAASLQRRTRFKLNDCSTT